jgi:Fe2+ or Zn2+ uptake regulation protein
VSKYREIILKVVSDKEIKSTNQILKEVAKLSGKVVNWHMVYRVLMELQAEGKVQKIETTPGFFWKKKV